MNLKIVKAKELKEGMYLHTDRGFKKIKDVKFVKAELLEFRYVEIKLFVDDKDTSRGISYQLNEYEDEIVIKENIKELN